MFFRNLLDRLTFIRPSFRSEDQPHLSPGHPSLAQTSAQKPSEVFVEDPGLSTSVVKILDDPRSMEWSFTPHQPWGIWGVALKWIVNYLTSITCL